MLYEIISEETTETGTARRRKEAISARKNPEEKTGAGRKVTEKESQMKGSKSAESTGDGSSAHI